MDFYEFFAGGGMARLGLGANWRCVFANEIDASKCQTYQRNFSADGLTCRELLAGDIARLDTNNLPGQADLAWASFPCQDLSLAGVGDGLRGKRSGLFWEFWRLMQGLASECRAPRIVIIENVYGAVTSHGGRDLAAICTAFAALGYHYAPLVVDAALFLPHSRPRLFVIGYAANTIPPVEISHAAPIQTWHPDALALAYDQLDTESRQRWLWLDLPMPPARAIRLNDLIEDQPKGVNWHTPFETQRLLAMMSPLNQQKLTAAKQARTRQIGAIYKRTRLDEYGIKRQRAEVRFDNVAGCLRTPAGGSSRQIILVVEGEKVRSRLLSPREAARLMGLPDTYVLPNRYNDAYHLAGDGVATPVVSWLARQVVEPALFTDRTTAIQRMAA